MNKPDELAFTSIDSERKKLSRNSNVEFLRLLAMFLVLILHADYISIGIPTEQEAVDALGSTFLRCLIQAVSIISVNLFVMISGWFGIKFQWRGLIKLVYQSLFIIVFVYIISILLGYRELNFEGIYACFFESAGCWFILAYIGLWILAPVLNSFIQNSTKKSLRTVLIAFYIFQTLYGFFPYDSALFDSGYSIISFIGLYLLAGYFRTYWSDNLGIINRSRIICLVALGCNIICFWLTVRIGLTSMSDRVINYTNPLTIITALTLLISVIRMRPSYSRGINYVASSAFAVYLIHNCNYWSGEIYHNVTRQIYFDFSGWNYWWRISLFLTAVFTAGIIVDQLRKVTWYYLCKWLE